MSELYEDEPPLNPEWERVRLIECLNEIVLTRWDSAAVRVSSSLDAVMVLAGKVEPLTTSEGDYYRDTIAVVMLATSLDSSGSTAVVRFVADNWQSRGHYNLNGACCLEGLTQDTAEDDERTILLLDRIVWDLAQAERVMEQYAQGECF